MSDNLDVAAGKPQVAGDRPPKLRSGRRVLVGALVVGLLVTGVAVAATGALAPGDVIPGSDEPTPPPENRLDVDETVLASGLSEVGGPWRLTAYPGTDSDSPDRPLPCVRLTLTDPPKSSVLAGAGFCGEPGASGVMAASLPMKDEDGDAELMIVGRAPAEAASIDLVDNGERLARVATTPSAARRIAGDVWVLTVPPTATAGELRWVDADGNPTATKLDTSGFFDRLEAIEGSGS